MTLVSVLLPVHNGARYVQSAALSILNQTHRDLELIVVDDGSTDGSGQIVAALGDPRVRLIRSETNRGLSASLNLGLKAARAGIVARQDADDLSHPRRLGSQVAFLEANPDVGLVGTQAWLIDEQGRCLGSIEHACAHESLIWELMFDNAFIHTSVAFRREVAAAEHGYDETWTYNQDYDLWLRLSRATRLANLPERLVAWRTHAASMTATMGKEAAASNRLILARNLPRVVGEISADSVELVARAREGMDGSDLRLLLPLLEAWVSSYRAAIPPRSDLDFRRTLARQYLKLAFTRRGRTLARLATALWGGRREAPEVCRALFALAVQRAQLRVGYKPLAAFGVARR